LNEEQKEVEGEDPQSVVNAWNAVPGVSHCRQLSASRRKALTKRLSDQWWRDNWRAAIARIPSARFLIGENKQGWKANFDWFLRPDSVLRILENAYDSHEPTTSNRAEGERLKQQMRRSWQSSLCHPDDLRRDWNVVEKKGAPGVKAHNDPIFEEVLGPDHDDGLSHEPGDFCG
jgi:hypothetical protein